MCQSIGPCVLFVFVFVCDIKSEYQQKPCHLCQTFIKFHPLLHKTQQGAAGTKVPRHDKFRSIISLKKIAY